MLGVSRHLVATYDLSTAQVPPPFLVLCFVVFERKRVALLKQYKFNNNNRNTQYKHTGVSRHLVATYDLSSAQVRS